jgi:putative membrane protein
MLREFIIRVAVNAIAIAVAAAVLPGINVRDESIATYLLLGLVFGLVNGLVKPILALLTCPLIIVTLGLFILVINGLILMLTGSLTNGLLSVDGLGIAILGGIVMGLVNVVLEALFGLGKGDV